MLKSIKIFLISYFLFQTSFFYSQNLVPNPSFETYTTCPNALDQMKYCSNWFSFRDTPDYFNSCSSVFGIAPPYSAFGFQWPNSGNAYAGIITYYGPSSNYREIISSQLTSTLQVGIKYFISFFVNMAGITYTVACNNLGAKFSKVPFSTITPIPINNTAHIYTNTVITDTAGWVQIKGSFVADSTYKYIMIGNFFNDISTSTLSIGGTGNPSSYYYIDDVCVSTDSLYSVVWTNNYELSFNRIPISISPIPASDYLQFKFSDKLPQKIQLLNTNGVVVLEKDISHKEFEFSLDISTLQSGVYIANIQFQKSIERKKIIIYR